VSFGNDATGYSTSQSEHHRTKEIEKGDNARDRMKQLKTELTSTSYVLGDEKTDYDTSYNYGRGV
jgi:transposase